MTDELVETLSSLEHGQWMEWAMALLDGEKLSDERRKRWNEVFVPYVDLSEEMKEHDRKWARQVIKAIEETHVLAPKEPTEVMLKAAFEWETKNWGFSRASYEPAYLAMLEAIPND